jgi:hypothetical protein
MTQVFTILLFYAVACITFVAIYIVLRFDQLWEESLDPYCTFILGVIYVILSSPFWMPGVLARMITITVKKKR